MIEIAAAHATSSGSPREFFAHDATPTPTPTPTGTAIDVRVTLHGPLARLWRRILRKGFSASVPADLDRLIALVEKASVDQS